MRWKEQSYADCTWEKESIIKSNQKLEEFRSINKMPNKDVREGLENQSGYHIELLTFYKKYPDILFNPLTSINRYKKTQNVVMAENVLYKLGRKHDHPKEYKGKDVLVFKDYKLLKDFQN